MPTNSVNSVFFQWGYNKRLVNKIALFTTIPPLCYSIFFVYAHREGLVLLNLFFVASFLMPIFFNKSKQFFLAKIWLIASLYGAIVLYDSLLGASSGIYFVGISVAALSLLIFSPKNKYGFCIILGVPLFLGCLIIGSGHALIPVRLDMPQHYLFVMYYLSLLTTFCISMVSIRYNMLLNFQFEDSLIKINTDLAQSNQALQEAYSSLEKTNALVDSLSHQALLSGVMRGISHELKNPLTSIFSVCDMLLMNKEVDEKMASQLRLIMQDAQRASQLLSSMLKDTSTNTNANQDIDIATMMDQVKRLLGDHAFHHKISFEVILSDALPTIKGTAIYISQTFLNLAVNAINNTKAGGKLTIEARHNTATSCVDISVTDTGDGISEDMLPHIFDPTGAISKKGSLGVGLGLVFVKRVVDSHNATIHVSSIPGEGSCFTVSFPVA